MLIRSQNKEVLVNFNVSTGVEIAEGSTKTVITSYITGCSYLLGEYSNRKKAVKVLDMLQEAYASEEITKAVLPKIGEMIGNMPSSKTNGMITESITEVLTKKMYFQMPTEDEVEI